MQNGIFGQPNRAICRVISVSLLMLVSANVCAEGWSGFYLGGDYGQANVRTDWTYNNANYFNSQGPVVLGSDFNVNASGNMGGIFLGYNYAISSFVLGLEGALEKASLNDTTDSVYYPATDTNTTNINRFSTVKGRIGYANPSWFISFNGGWATAKVNLSAQNASTNIMASSSQWVNGWVTGTAVEYKLTERFSFGFTYDYMKLKLNNKNLSCDNCGTGVGLASPNVSTTLKVKTVATRLSYYFS